VTGIQVTHENDNLDSFDDNRRKKQRLHRETYDSIENIKNDLVPSLEPERLKSFKVGLYNSAPEAFLLVTDEAVLVEQYHYGLIIEEAEHRRILGGNVPLTEYKKEEANIYQIFKDHFDYVCKYWTDFVKFSDEE